MHDLGEAEMLDVETDGVVHVVDDVAHADTRHALHHLLSEPTLERRAPLHTLEGLEERDPEVPVQGARDGEQGGSGLGA